MNLTARRISRMRQKFLWKDKKTLEILFDMWYNSVMKIVGAPHTPQSGRQTLIFYESYAEK